MKSGGSEETTILAVTHDRGIAGKTDMSFEMEDGRLAPGKVTGGGDR